MKMTDASPSIDERLEIRRQEAAKIDVTTAVVTWTYALTADPYGDYPDLAPEYQTYGREFFARSPGSKIWVSFQDLPSELSQALLDKWDADLEFEELPF